MAAASFYFQHTPFNGCFQYCIVLFYALPHRYILIFLAASHSHKEKSKKSGGGAMATVGAYLISRETWPIVRLIRLIILTLILIPKDCEVTARFLLLNKIQRHSFKFPLKQTSLEYIYSSEVMSTHSVFQLRLQAFVSTAGGKQMNIISLQ